MADAIQARQTVNRIRTSLEHAIAQLKTHVTKEGRLDPDDQHAVRILQSRMRLLNRLWNFLYGSPLEKEIANVELNVIYRRDDGTLEQLGERLHSVGRFDCRACNVIDDGTGNLRPGTLLCPWCCHGVYHVFTSREGYPTGGNPNPIAPGASNEPQEASEVGTPVVQVSICDSCHQQERKVIGRVEPVKEQWKEFRITRE